MEGNYHVDPKDAEDNKIMGILAYLGILVLVPILAAKESPFARFHANQGLVLCIAAIAAYIAALILGAIFALVSLTFLAIFGLLYTAIWICFIVFMIIGIINAAKGEMKELPLIGKIKILK
jgi:uncharacterized membrane protein